MGDMGELFRALKEENAKHREKNYDKRIKFAIKCFNDSKIPYKLCNESNAHFNLYNSKGNVVMSFWAWTGKIFIPNKKTNARGIRMCCSIYNKTFKEMIK